VLLFDSTAKISSCYCSVSSEGVPVTLVFI
jgi:hypothetical protein